MKTTDFRLPTLASSNRKTPAHMNVLLLRSTSTRLLISLVAMAALSLQADPTPPDKMTYQGYLVDANGHVLAENSTANYPAVFRIYDASQGGVLLWSEQQIITVDKGNFSVVLGEGTQYQSEARNSLASVFNGTGASDRYMGISVTIGTTTKEIMPRLRLLTSPYAFLAKSANSLVGADGSPLVTTASGGTLNAGGNVNANGNVSATGNVVAGGSLSASGMNVTGTATATKFVGFGIVPIGGIIMYYGATSDIPEGWALCNGDVYDTTTGKRTPDLRDRFIIGAGHNYAQNITGGSTTKTLAAANLPGHTHSYADNGFTADNRNAATIALNNTGWLGNPTSPVPTRNTDSGSGLNNTAFDIMPPYFALAFIMRTK
jgi:microcystin-dependent protein